MFTKFDHNVFGLRYFQVLESLPQKCLEHCVVVAILIEDRLDRRVTHKNGDVNANGGCHTGDVYFRFRFTVENEPQVNIFYPNSDSQVLYLRTISTRR